MRIIVGIDSDPFTASYLPEDLVLRCIYLTKLKIVEPMEFLKGTGSFKEKWAVVSLK